MASIGEVFDGLLQRSERLGECGQAGVIAGAVSGGLLSLLSFVHVGQQLAFSAVDAVIAVLLLTATAWLVLLFIFVGLLRRRPTSVALPSLVNAFLVTLLTVVLSVALHVLILAWLIGMFVGALVGYVLCRIFTRLTGGTDDGVH